MKLTPTNVELDEEWANSLRELDDLEQEYARELGLMGSEESEPEEQEPAPFDLEVPRPRAVPLESLFAVLDQELDPEVRTLLATRTPLLIHQGITAFNPPGRAPASVWGMGYEFRLKSPDADTVSLQPSGELLEIAQVEQEIDLSLGLGGSIEIPSEVLQLTKWLPGISLNGVRVGASTNQSAKLGVRMGIELLKCQAGPVGAGGARWNFYRQDERLDTFTPLLHTILVPRDTKSLEVGVRTWVVRAGRWFGLQKPVKWESEELPFTVPVEGL